MEDITARDVLLAWRSGWVCILVLPKDRVLTVDYLYSPKTVHFVLDSWHRKIADIFKTEPREGHRQSLLARM